MSPAPGAGASGAGASQEATRAAPASDDTRDARARGEAAVPASGLTGVAAVIEIAMTIGIGYACHLYYNLIGHIAGQLSSARGVDFGPALVTPLDRAMPYLPVLAPFYAVAYVAPAIVIAVIVPRAGREVAAYRRMIVAFLALLATHYTIYLLLPTSAFAMRLPDAAIGGGFFGSVVRGQYRIATPWCAFPSLHVSACWFFYRILSRYRPKTSRLYLLWFVGMFFGTFGIKIHFIADAVAGWLLGESANRFILRRLDRADALHFPGVPRAARLAALLVVLGLLGAGLPLLMNAVGFTGPLYTLTP